MMKLDYVQLKFEAYARMVYHNWVILSMVRYDFKHYPWACILFILRHCTTQPAPQDPALLRCCPHQLVPASRSLIFGLGPSITSEDGIITGAKLPTGRQILRCMLAKKPGANGALSQFEAAKVVLEQVRPFYTKCNIPVVSDKRACHKMVDLVNANNKLREISQAKRSSEITAKQLEKMECRLDATFPLWPPNVEKLIDNPEDLAFLASMKTDMSGHIWCIGQKAAAQGETARGASSCRSNQAVPLWKGAGGDDGNVQLGVGEWWGVRGGY